MRVPAAGEDAKFAVFGALDYASGKVLWQLSPAKDGAAFVAFLDHLAAQCPEGPLVVVLDNVGYHKGRRARAWWMAHQDRVRPLWLPAYAPELNPVEYLNNDMKGTVNEAGLPPDRPTLRGRLLGFMRRLVRVPEHAISYFLHPWAQYAAPVELI